MNADVETSIEKLQKVIEVDERERFTDSDIMVLHKMIDLWKAFEVLGKIANTGRNVAIWVAGFALLWFTPFDQVLKTIRKMLGME